MANYATCASVFTEAFLCGGVCERDTRGVFLGCKADWGVVSLSPSDMGRLSLSA